MNARTLLAGTLFSLVAVGCAGPKAPTEKNFSKAIEPVLAKQSRCIRDLPIGEDRAREGAEPNRGLEALAGLGLVHAERRIVDTGRSKYWDPFGHGPKETLKDTSIVYTLTPQGETVSRKDEYGQVDFCYGTPQLEKVVRWTEPTEQLGPQMTEVTYTYTLTDVPAWAKDPDVQHAFGLEEEMKRRTEPAEDKMVLVLTNEGWRAEP